MDDNQKSQNENSQALDAVKGANATKNAAGKGAKAASDTGKAVGKGAVWFTKKGSRLILFLGIGNVLIGLGLFLLFLIMFAGFASMSDSNDSTIGLTAIGEKEIPAEYIPLYQAAGEVYGMQWTLLAAVHKVETNFGTSPSMVSSAGALGHMQVRP